MDWRYLEKGGGYKSWSGLQVYLVDWRVEGVRIKEHVIRSYPYLNGNYEWVVKNAEYYFQRGLTYTQISKASLGFRVMNDSAFMCTSSGVFLKKGANYSLNVIATYLNSPIVTYMGRSISQKFSFESGHIALIPVPDISNISQKLEVVAIYFLALTVLLDSLVVTERVFDESMLIPKNSMNRRDLCAAFRSFLYSFVARETNKAIGITSVDAAVIFSETGTPAGFHPLLAGYDALPELPPELELPELPGEVLEYLERHERISPLPAELARLKSRLRALYEAGPGAKDDGADDEASESAGDDEEGEEAVAGAHIPIPTETFLEELSVRIEMHPISVYWLLEELRAEGARCKPEERRLLEDRLSVLALRLLGHRWPKQIEAGEPLPGWADPDGIIPLVNLGTGEATLAARLRERLRDEDGETGAQRSEALLAELTGATSLEDWCARLFWPRHVKQFKSRPVAWHLASRPAGAGKKRGNRQPPLFECMLYYHATGGDALARLRTQYVEPLLRREESALGEALGKRNSEAAASANARVEELRDFLGRLQQVEREGFACAELDALLAKEPLDRWSSDGIAAPDSADDLARQERAWRVDINDGVRVNIAPLQLAGALAGEVLKAADAKKAIADRTRWRADERRWVREGKLPRCGWMDEGVPESPAWTKRAPERADEQRKLEEKRAALAGGQE